MIRAFIAVTLEPQVVTGIAEAIDRLRPEIAGVRWARTNYFHVTLKFLGDIEESAVDPIRASLTKELRLFPRCTINAKGLGVFPELKRPRVLWVGLTGSRLISLALKVESALEGVGFAPETRKFTPHLTIGRWRQAVRAPQTLERQLREWQAHDFGASRIETVKLIQSVLHPESAEYRELAAVPLSGQPTAH